MIELALGRTARSPRISGPSAILIDDIKYNYLYCDINYCFS